MTIKINEIYNIRYQYLKIRYRVGTKCKEYLTEVNDVITYRTIKELLPYCHETIKEPDLNRRIRAIYVKEGMFKSIYEAMKAPIISNNKKVARTEEKLDTWFDDHMKLMKPGSLHKQARIMQAYPIGKRYG